jgi:uncharacterized membrane protein YeaQ/YmgE (transglycosylase-associated protein family)
VTIFFWLVIGMLLGWLASKAIATGDRLGLLLNLVVGGVAAFLGTCLSWMIGLNNLDVGGVLIPLLSATILLTVARLARVTG